MRILQQHMYRKASQSPHRVVGSLVKGSQVVALIEEM